MIEAETAPRYQRLFLMAGAINGFLAVALGAFGAHALRPLTDDRGLQIFQTGTHYHGLHALALITAGLLIQRLPTGWGRASGWLFLLGILVFSGSLYAMALGAPRWLGAVTPVGGTAFLAGWASLAVGVARMETT
ncbi:MAG: DUF423 domain-containing protein [Pseudomonadota bacterium]